MPIKVARQEIEFDQYITPDGQIVNLNGVQGKFVISHTGHGMPGIEYVTQRGPFQHGETPLGFRLSPRYIQYVIRQQECSRQGYWSLREALIDAMRPNRQIYTDFRPGVLRKILPNGSKRDIKVLFDSGLVYAPSETSKWDEWAITETIRFVAHDPIIYDPVAVALSFEMDVNDSLLFGVDQLVERINLVTNPSFELGTTGWTSANTIEVTDDTAYVGLRSAKITYVATTTLASYSITLPTPNTTYVLQARIYVPSTWDGGSIEMRGANFAGATNAVRNPWWMTGKGGDRWAFISTILSVEADVSGQIDIVASSGPTAGKDMRIDAVMVEEDDAGIGHPYFDGSVNWAIWTGTEHASTSAQGSPSKVNPVTQLVLPVVFASDSINEIIIADYAGTWLSYPEIVITGPISYPVVQNVTTGQKIALEMEVAEGQSIVIDTSYGNKTVTDRYGVNYISALSPDSDLATFSIEASPVAPDGLNYIWVWGSLGKPNVTGVVITYNTRYIGI